MLNLSKFAETLDYLIFEQNTKRKTDAKSLAKELGVEGSTITRYLREERAPTIEILVLLADYFDCTTDYLLGRESQNYRHSFHACPPFSVQLCRLLEEYHYNCYTFSLEAHIHQSCVYNWKNGKRKPTLDNVVKIAEFFDCTVDRVLGREG